MPHKITVRTNGQTLTVNASISHWTSEALALAASSSNDVESTTTTTIRSDYDLWFANTATEATITVKSSDGTELLAQTFPVTPGHPNRVLNPLPTVAQLAADSQTGQGGFTVGDYYMTFQSTNTATQLLTLDRLLLQPWYLPENVTIDRLGAEVTSAGSAGSVVRLGIYADNGAGLPGSLVLDAGTIDGTSNTVQTITLDPTTSLTRGLYWWGCAAQVAACTIRAHSGLYAGVPITFGTSAPTADLKNVSVYQSSVSGALPATFTKSGNTTTNTARLHFRVA